MRGMHQNWKRVGCGILYSPENEHRTWKPKIAPLKGKSSSKPPILGSRLVFGSVTGIERTLEDLRIGAHFWSSKRRAREEARHFQQRFLLGLSTVFNMLNFWTLCDVLYDFHAQFLCVSSLDVLVVSKWCFPQPLWLMELHSWKLTGRFIVKIFHDGMG